MFFALAAERGYEGCRLGCWFEGVWGEIEISLELWVNLKFEFLEDVNMDALFFFSAREVLGSGLFFIERLAGATLIPYTSLVNTGAVDTRKAR